MSKDIKDVKVKTVDLSPRAKKAGIPQDVVDCYNKYIEIDPEAGNRDFQKYIEDHETVVVVDNSVLDELIKRRKRLEKLLESCSPALAPDVSRRIGEITFEINNQ